MARHLLITIAGEAKTGRSSIAAHLADLFRQYGVTYHLIDPDIDPTIIPHSHRDIEEVMRAMVAKDITVTITTSQLVRPTAERETVPPTA